MTPSETGPVAESGRRGSRSNAAGLVAFEDALAAVLAAFRPLPPEIVSLSAALGRVLADDLAARASHPPADVSAMDGYAVRAADVSSERVPAKLRLIGRAAAGADFCGILKAGEAVRIFTGARLPAGADAIVIQEHAEEQDGTVFIGRPASLGRWIRRFGQDFTAGEVLLRAGRRLTSRDVGLAAAMDVPWLVVRRKPHIAVLSTGDELVRPGERRTEDQLVDSGGIACAQLLRAWGAEPISLGIARDDPCELATMFRAAHGCDLLITIGGASVGELDLVRRVLDADGFEASFHRVAMRPGKPLLFGRLGAVPVLGLPGNPVSAWVTALLFACPAVGTMLGRDPPGLTPELVLSGNDLPANDERRDHLRATLRRRSQGELVADVLPGQDSAMIRTLADADCLVLRPPSAPPVHAGERVSVLRLDAASFGT